MATGPDPRRNEARIRLLEQFRERLETAEELTSVVRAGLKTADAVAIEEATSRLETLALEFRVLEQEYRRLPAQPAGAVTDPALARSLDALEQAVLRIARSAAVGSGLLERLVSMSRNLIASIGGCVGESYLPSGRSRELPFEGYSLRETV